jgi:hypothetical protein
MRNSISPVLTGLSVLEPMMAITTNGGEKAIYTFLNAGSFEKESS